MLLLIQPSHTALREEDLSGALFFSENFSLKKILEDLTGFLIAVAAGGAILSCYVGLLSYIGSDTGLSFDLLARRSFGRRGSMLPSLLIAVTQIGWFGVGAAMFAFPVSAVLHIPPAVLILIAGVCMTASAYHGIRGMEIVSYISVPLKRERQWNTISTGEL